MSSYVLPFRNFTNFAKCQIFNYEVGTNTMILVLEWLHKGPKPMEKHFVDLAKKKSNNFNSSEKDELQKLKDCKMKIGELDLSLLYKIVKITCGLLPQDNEVWSKKCPTLRQSELEHCLFKLKDGRNNLAHPSDDVKNLTDIYVEKVCEEMKDLVADILGMAGTRAKIDAAEVDKEVTLAQEKLGKICKGENLTDYMKTHLKNIILNDLKATYEEELIRSFSNELRGYSIPNLRREDQMKPIILTLNEIFNVCDSRGIVVLGTAGSGKSAMTRFLFNSWLSGNTSNIHGLSSFDIVLRVECQSLNIRDVSEFLGENFKTAKYSFSNTTSLMQHLDQFNVLWIMDGFDESTAESKGFLENILRRLPKEHKIIVTSRLNCNEDLLKFFSNTDNVTLYLELLTDSNINEIISSLIIEEVKRKSFADKCSFFNDTVINALKTPLNMVMYIELWLDDPEQEVGTCTTTNLYLKINKMQMSRLEKKLYNHTSYSTADLKLNLDFWFYNCLCKHSFLLVCKGKYYIDNEIMSDLEIEATKVRLESSFCLSAFLSEGKGNEKCQRYNFNHTTQAFFFSSLFLKKLNNYHGFSFIDLYSEEEKKFTMFYHIESILENFSQMIAEESIIDPTSKTDVSNIKPLVSLCNEPTQGYLWFVISYGSNFNDQIMKNISSLINNCLHLDDRIEYHPAFRFEFFKFLSHIDLKELIIHSDPISSIEEYGMEILHLKDRRCKIEIKMSQPIEESQEKMAIVEEHYWNRIENATHQLLYIEAANNVFVKILHWFYKDHKAIENQIASLREDFSNKLNTLERNELDKITKGERGIADVGFPLLVKVTRLLTGTEQTIRKEDKLCDLLQHLTDEFNQLPNPSLKTIFEEELIMEDYTDINYHFLTSILVQYGASKRQSSKLSVVTKKAEELKKLQALIIYAVGRRAKIDRKEVEVAISGFKQNISDILGGKNLTMLLNKYAEQIVFKDINDAFEENYERSNDSEMKRYSAARLNIIKREGDQSNLKVPYSQIHDNSNRTIDLSNILTYNVEARAILVKGMASTGKNALTRYLYNTWLRGDGDAVHGLQTFNLVIRVECSQLKSLFVSRLLENLFPKSTNIFPSIWHLKKYLDTLNILWILDEADKCPIWAGKLLYGITQKFPSNHKFIFTARRSFVRSLIVDSRFSLELPRVTKV